MYISGDRKSTVSSRQLPSSTTWSLKSSQTAPSGKEIPSVGHFSVVRGSCHSDRTYSKIKMLESDSEDRSVRFKISELLKSNSFLRFLFGSSVEYFLLRFCSSSSNINRKGCKLCYKTFSENIFKISSHTVLQAINNYTFTML